MRQAALLLLTGAAVTDAECLPQSGTPFQQTACGRVKKVLEGPMMKPNAADPAKNDLAGYKYVPDSVMLAVHHKIHNANNAHMPVNGPNGVVPLRLADGVAYNFELTRREECPPPRGGSHHHLGGKHDDQAHRFSLYVEGAFLDEFGSPEQIKLSNQRCSKHFDIVGGVPVEGSKIWMTVTVAPGAPGSPTRSPLEVWKHQAGVFCSKHWDHAEAIGNNLNLDGCKHQCLEHNKNNAGAPCLGVSVTNAQWPHPESCGLCIHAEADGQLQLGMHGSFNLHHRAGGDPFTSYKGKTTQFYLPIHTPVQLLTCGGVAMYGQTMPSGVAGDAQQWFEKIDVRVGEKNAMSVAVRNTTQLVPSSRAKADLIDVDVLATQNRVAAALATLRRQASVQNAAARELTTLDVTVDGRAVTTTATRTDGAVNITVTQGTQRIGSGFVESVDFDSETFGIQVQSSAATKFHDRDQVAFTHLDMTFKNIEANACTGPLPEIWGVQPMTPTTAKYLSPYYQVKFIPMK